MLCVVYVLRKKGKKLPPEQVRARPATGYLYLGQDPVKFVPQTVARLLRDHKTDIDVVEPMAHAHVKVIKGGGLLIFGQQSIGYQQMCPQVWWAVPGLLDDMTAL